ncbi:unnamed protein product [Rotaria sordida]|uniref:SWIM-type domain-containing protein n=1 Tax=Rotaria sordida TaxID=392033 RepID=A0A814QDV7_9BILA|nr:unnamed protein product [Rotaria sordida]CAF1335162.1 unnamed protein product [Rotaria sordida]
MTTVAEIVEVPTYVSDDEVDKSETVDNGNKKRAKKRQRNWVEEMVFNNTEEAEEVVIKENQWSYHYTNTTAAGKKKFFRCNKAKARGKQCDAGIYLLFESTNDKVVLFRTTSDHTHDDIQEKPSRIPTEVKKIIQDLFELKLKPKAIVEVLHERGIALPSIHQLNNFLRTIKSTKLGPTSISLGEIEQWCLESSQSIPESDDTPFVASYQIIYDDENENEDIDDDDINENKFRFFITTKRLLQIASRSKKIHADATYKLLWQGFPVLIVGTTDLDRHFHLFGMAVCSNEATQDFRFIFRALQEGLQKLNLEEINPDFLITDGADAMRNAFQDVFGEKPMVMCWAHMRRKVVKKIESMVEKSKQEDLVNDIESLQLAQNERIFMKASTLFVKKWSKTELNFIEYFQNEWLTTHNAWYEGVGHFTPSTNNALEAINNVIKKENTLRERLPVSRFKVLAFEIVEKWSKCYERGLKQYNYKQTISLELWTSGYQWVKSNKSILSTECDNLVQYYIPAGNETKITNGEIDVVKKMKWYSFDQYKKKAFNIWSVTLPVDKLKWLEGVCNCPAFFKKFMCKHVVGMAIRLNYCKPPPAAKNIKIGEKRRRGRPAKSKKALLMQ